MHYATLAGSKQRLRHETHIIAYDRENEFKHSILEKWEKGGALSSQMRDLSGKERCVLIEGGYNTWFVRLTL
jgi:hypothetical protein